MTKEECTLIVIVIVNSKLLKRNSKAKRRAPAYSRALRQIRRGFPKNSLWEAQVRLPEGERMRLRVRVGLTVPPSPIYILFSEDFPKIIPLISRQATG